MIQLACLRGWLIALFWVATVVGLALLLDCSRRLYWTSWYDNSHEGYLRDPDWDDEVHELLTGDPLEAARRCRFRDVWSSRFERARKDGSLYIQIFLDLAGGGGLVFLWAFFGYAVYFGKYTQQADITRAGQDWLPVFLVGCGTVAASLLGLAVQTRLAARSKNRQDWIDQMRSVLAELIADLPWPRDGGKEKERKRKEYFPRHAKLELLLNPSEHIHRTLIALIRHAYGFDNVAIDEQVRTHFPEIFEVQFQTRDKQDQHLRALKSQIIRLANVALKREWEQVKHAR